MEQEFYRGMAVCVRAMADMADPFTRSRLLKLADRYDAKCVPPLTGTGPRPLPRPSLSVAQGSGKV
nr:hypothetical protein [Bradyrhizobium sp. Cp5.3]